MSNDNGDKGPNPWGIITLGLFLLLAAWAIFAPRGGGGL